MASPLAQDCERKIQSSHKVYYFEWLRCIGAAAVVMIHVTSGIMDNYPVAKVGIARALAWSEMQVALLRWAVPAFLMITGALLLNPDKNVGWEKVAAYVRRMALVLCTFGLAFCFLQELFVRKTISIGLLTSSVLDLLSGRGFSHLWYVYALIGIYLLLPVMKAYIASADKGSQLILLAILFAFTCVIPTINAALGLELTTFIWLSSSMFYVVLGYYAHSYMRLSKPILVVGVLSLVVNMILKACGILFLGDYWKWVHGPACPLEAAWSLCVFLLAHQYLERPFAKGGIISTLASLSFGVYVMHPLFINVMYRLIGYSPWTIPPVVFEFSVWSLAFFGSCALVSLIRRVPGMGHLL